jgi:hypothetical protein
MVGIIGTSSPWQPVITAHTLTSFWIISRMNCDSCLTTALWRISHSIERTNELPFLTATRPEYKSHIEQLIVLCYSVCCYGNLVFSNLLPSNESFVAICCSGNVICKPLLSNGLLLWLHVTICSWAQTWRWLGRIHFVISRKRAPTGTERWQWETYPGHLLDPRLFERGKWERMKRLRWTPCCSHSSAAFIFLSGVACVTPLVLRT